MNLQKAVVEKEGEINSLEGHMYKKYRELGDVFNESLQKAISYNT